MTRARKFSVCAMAVAACLDAAPLWASESGEAKAGLPQLDMTLIPAQLFWLAVSFGVLYVLMRYVALPGVQRVQDHRRTIITGELAAATAAQESAKAMIATYEKALSDARTQAQTTVATIKLQADKESAERQAAQDRILAQQVQQAEARIGAARDAAMADLDAAVGDLAGVVVERVSGLKLAPIGN